MIEQPMRVFQRERRGATIERTDQAGCHRFQQSGCGVYCGQLYQPTGSWRCRRQPERVVVAVVDRGWDCVAWDWGMGTGKVAAMKWHDFEIMVLNPLIVLVVVGGAGIVWVRYLSRRY